MDPVFHFTRLHSHCPKKLSTFFFSSPPVRLFIAAGIPHQTPHLQAAQPAIAGQAAVPLGGWIFGQGQGQRLGRLYPVQPRHRVPGFAMYRHTGRFLCCVHCMRPPDPVCSAKVCIILPRPAMHRTHVTHACTKTHTHNTCRGDAVHDNLCAQRTRCTAQTQRATYEVRAAVDSTSFLQNGTDSICASYSSCPPGAYMSFQGNDTADVECTACPPGTYRGLEPSNAAGISCLPCPDGTYASQPGSTSCTQCTDCLLGTNASLALCPFRPVSRHCTAAAVSACSPTSDSECVLCPSLSEDAGYDVRGGMCVACRAGYYYNASVPAEGMRCVPCPEGFYCPHSRRGEVVECPGAVVIKRSPQDAGYTVLPTTPARGASRAEQCMCGLAGGFEPSAYSQALLGCMACPDGYYAPPNSSQGCQACPVGKFSFQQRGLPNFKGCVKDPASFEMLPSCVASASTAYPLVDAGALECLPCPDAGRPYTWGEASTSPEDCRYLT